MSIQTELTRITNAKAAIKTAIDANSYAPDVYGWEIVTA